VACPSRLKILEFYTTGTCGACGLSRSSAPTCCDALVRFWPISETQAAGRGVCLLRVHPPPETSFCRERQDGTVKSRFLAFFLLEFLLPPRSGGVTHFQRHGCHGGHAAGERWRKDEYDEFFQSAYEDKLQKHGEPYARRWAYRYAAKTVFFAVVEWSKLILVLYSKFAGR
jgi:hypothetical protein